MLPTGVERIVKMKAILSRRREQYTGYGHRAGSRTRRFRRCASTYAQWDENRDGSGSSAAEDALEAEVGWSWGEP